MSFCSTSACIPQHVSDALVVLSKSHKVLLQGCEAAGVPLEVVPLSQQYWDRVVHESVSEIRAGRTPNPDILCNSR